MKYLNLPLLPIRRNYRFFVFILLLHVLCFVAICGARGGKKEMFFDLYVLCALLALLPDKIRPWVSGCIAVVEYLTAIVDIYCFENFGTSINPMMIMLLNETNPTEASNFLHTFMSAKVLSGYIPWILILSVLHIAAFVERKRMSKFLRGLADKVLDKIGSVKYRYGKTVMALICSLIVVWGG